MDREETGNIVRQAIADEMATAPRRKSLSREFETTVDPKTITDANTLKSLDADDLLMGMAVERIEEKMRPAFDAIGKTFVFDDEAYCAASDFETGTVGGVVDAVWQMVLCQRPELSQPKVADRRLQAA